MKAFIGLATGQDEAARLQKLVADYPERVARVVAKRRDAVQDARANEAWGGWSWRPSREESARYVGAFASERLGTLDVVQGPAGLEARLGAMRLELVPAAVNLFGASESALDAPLEFRYADDAQSLQWKSDTFRRID
jgi:hypothetical protein